MGTTDTLQHMGCNCQQNGSQQKPHRIGAPNHTLTRATPTINLAGCPAGHTAWFTGEGVPDAIKHGWLKK